MQQTSIATVNTTNASRYLQQLCKHWSHKFTVEFDAQAGKIPFNETSALTLLASGDVLTMTLEADAEQQIRMQGVVDDHLKRFAFKEDLHIVWGQAA